MSKREMRRTLARGRASALLSEIVGRDYGGRPMLVEASGGGKRGYNVKLIWTGTTVKTSCGCMGSFNGVCFHQIGGAIKSLEELGTVAISPFKGNLTLLARTGGHIYTIRTSSGKEIYALVKPTQNKTVYDEKELPGELTDMATAARAW